RSVVQTYQGAQRINLKAEADECWLKVDTLVPLGLLLHELVSNAVLHAFDKQEDKIISLKFAHVGTTHYVLMVADNGSGLPGSDFFETGKTLGVQLINSLAKQLKARLQLSTATGKGTEVSIIFPQPKP